MFEKAGVYLQQRSQAKEENSYHDLNAGRLKASRLHIFTGWRLKDGAGLVALLAAGFLLGRAFLLGELLPFGVALVAAGFVFYREYALAALAGAVLGLYVAVSGWELAVRVVALVAVSVAVLSLPQRLGGQRLWLGGLVFAVQVVVGTGYVAITGPTTYEYIRVLFEAIFAALLAVAYWSAFGGLRRYVAGERVTVEQIFCFIILLVSIVAAAGQMRWGMVSPGGILAALAVLVTGYAGGAGLGAAAGAIIGVLPGLVFSVSPAALGAFAFAGFLGGLCRGMKRIGVLAGFMLGGTLLTVYLGSGQDIAGLMVETALAGLVFLLLPETVFTAMQKNMPLAGPWVAATQPAKDVTDNIEGRLKRLGAIFEEISRTYDQVGGALEPRGYEAGWQTSINEVKNMVCEGCAMYKVCWEREYQLTYQHVKNCFAAAQKNGRVIPEDLDERLRLRCSCPRELITAINCSYRLWRMQQFWYQSMRESRELVSVQLQGMRGVIDNIARELMAGSENWWRRGEYLKQNLKQSGISVASLSLYPGCSGLEVELTIPDCAGKKRCVYDVAPLLSQLTGENLVCSVKDCVNWEQGDFCTIRLYPDPVYQLGIGLARCPGKGNEVSGDSCALMSLADGRLAVFVSDGMGSGAGAAAESKTTLALLQKLLKAGYSRDLAIRMVNAVMMRHMPGDNFATVDMSVVDLYDGKLEMVKIGAPPSFLVRQNQVQVIRASSLPVGIVDDINIFVEQGVMDSGDMLVMVTDGVSDAYPGKGEDEEWVASVLGEIIDLPPQEVAELILRLAISGNGGQRRAADDMTVLVVQLESSF